MYGKLFSQMYDGTLATKGPWEALVTFQQLIILADRNGIVDMTPEAIARRTTIPAEIIQKGLEHLLEPDPESRSPDEEGRRITRLSDSRAWGWQIVNYDHYRKIRSAEERREYLKKYQRERRAKSKAVNQIVNMSTGGTQCQPIAVSSKQKHKNTVAALPDWLPLDAWNGWIASRKKQPTGRALELAVAKLSELREDGQDPKAVLDTSTLHGWSGLFPLKVGQQQSKRKDGLVI